MVIRLGVAVLVAVFATALAADAQPRGEIHRIGYLGGSSAPTSARFVDAFRQGLRELGWVEGQNVIIDYRFADGRLDRLPELAAELVRLKVDVIVAGPSPPAVAARRATATIPIVMMGVGDPVSQGLIATLAHPSGNVTGLSFDVDLKSIGKGLELLKEFVPKVRDVAILWNPANSAQPLAMSNVRDVARSLGVELHPLPVRGLNEFEAAFSAMAKRNAGALLVLPDPVSLLHRVRLAELAIQRRLPSMYGARENVEAGGLMSYGASIVAIWRHAAVFVDKIFRGVKPGDLPVEQPTKFELVINLKTAKVLGLSVPPSLLLRADHVVE